MGMTGSWSTRIDTVKRLTQDRIVNFFPDNAVGKDGRDGVENHVQEGEGDLHAKKGQPHPLNQLGESGKTARNQFPLFHEGVEIHCYDNTSE